MESAILMLLLALGGIALLSAAFRPSAHARTDGSAVLPETARKSVAPDPDKRNDVLECGGIWARHPLKPELGWMVATTAAWPLRAGDHLCVTRHDGSESLETVERVVLELREPEGDVVGHLVEVKNVD